VAANNGGMKHFASVVPFLLLSSCLAQQPAETPKAEPLDWKNLEAPLLTHHVQLTKRDRFVKAGEAYFSPDGKWIIFQAVAVPEEGKEADPLYAMYVAKLTRDRFTEEVTGIEKVERISPDESANTCGWFHPTDPWRVLFGSTLTRPSEDQKSGFQVGTRKYTWMFPMEMEVAGRLVPAIFDDELNAHRDQLGVTDQQAAALETQVKASAATAIFTRPNYDAECSYSNDGRFILYTHLNDTKPGEKNDADIWIFDTKTKEQHCIVKAPGYDGGPFFSPDGKSICYRSDRKGDDLLQLFVADLRFDKDGVPIGIEREYQLTDNQAVNWAPFWHPSGQFLVYGTSEISHQNYEVFAIKSDMAALRAGTKPTDMPRRRITSADGADILPTFSPDGKLMMWTSQRGPKTDKEDKPSSQLWLAQWKGDPFAKAPATPKGND
jgi:dipeptidyl aminopeptidase/acylaminoacyl peptidase